MLSRIRRRLNVSLPLRTLFEGGTLAQLAQAVDQQAQVSDDSEIVPVPRNQTLALSYAQQRLWFLDRFEGPNAAYNMSSVVRLRGALDIAALQQALQRVLERHEALRTTFHLKGEQPCQVINEAPTLDLTPVNVESHALQSVIDRQSAQPFDLQQAPMLRAHLLHLGTDDHVLQLVLHHIATDAWSMGILIQELITGYQAYASGVNSNPPGAADPVRRLRPVATQRTPTTSVGAGD